ncbi:MAG: hypothetical protein AAF432_05665 [Planctomycetota bacterium]
MNIRRVLPFVVIVVVLGAMMMLVNRQRPRDQSLEHRPRSDRASAWLTDQLPAQFESRTGVPLTWNALTVDTPHEDEPHRTMSSATATDVVVGDGLASIESLVIQFDAPPMPDKRSIVTWLRGTADVSERGVPVRMVTALMALLRSEVSPWWRLDAIILDGTWEDRAFNATITRTDGQGTPVYSVVCRFDETAAELNGRWRVVGDQIAVELMTLDVSANDPMFDFVPASWRPVSGDRAMYTVTGLLEAVEADVASGLRCVWRTVKMTAPGMTRSEVQTVEFTLNAQ